jgi:hypothetical protein
MPDPVIRYLGVIDISSGMFPLATVHGAHSTSKRIEVQQIMLDLMSPVKRR